MSRTQCAKGTRTILVSNLLIDTLEEGDSTVVVSCNGVDRILRRDESFEIIQKISDRLVQIEKVLEEKETRWLELSEFL